MIWSEANNNLEEGINDHLKSKSKGTQEATRGSNNKQMQSSEDVVLILSVQFTASTWAKGFIVWLFI